ncbi:MAG: glutaredoxin family protein [Erysipelotrichaceae bacterium]|nr:glutaredoxin family protein [Erysipelotrichaceae bacterium]
MMKKILIILLFLLCACSKQLPVPEYPYEMESFKVDMSNYKGVSSTEHNFRLIHVSELFKCIDSKSSGIFYLGRENCHCCQQVIHYLNEAAEELGVTIYYINAYDEVEPLSDKERYDQLYEYLYDILGENDDGEKVLLTPHVFSIVNGEFYASQICYDDMEFSDEPTQGQIRKLENVYKDIMMPFVSH